MLANLMSSKVDIKRPKGEKDSSGTETGDTTTVYTAQPCSIQPVAASWVIRYAQRKIEVSHSLYFDRAIVVRPGDTIHFGSRTFFVAGVRNLVERGQVIVVDCREHMA